MTLLADLLSTVFERRHRLARTGSRDDRPIEALTAELIGASVEASGLAVARSLLERYAEMDDAAKRGFFHHLARDMNIDESEVQRALEAYAREQTKATYRSFMQAAEPPRQELIRRLNQVPGATAALVGMRADLLRLSGDEDALHALDLDFRHLFASWFNRGFLVLRPINWGSPAFILDKIIDYEAVHRIDSWDDLRRRLEPTDRRCFAFFHPVMPDEPLIFVEVALTRGVPGSIQGLLAESRDMIEAEDADTAVFYSISNCQEGLASISFGHSLIKQVAADLSAELPTLETFVTLSPIPGFAHWLADQDIAVQPDDTDRVRALAAHYLFDVKRSDGLPRDPVARFHLGNGAVLHQVHAAADLSENGLEQSKGAMVNYLYDFEKVARNLEGFAVAQTIAASQEVRALAAAARKAA
ncbi:malonyl-CoA decarboxylase [Roseivivax lentus]|uniref:Malonyl-CoA decarboxylase n=1 Tax=Roseivivax lentus TaxID=633194 RepID=A0A1N7KS37_9RHOB|nr:malonyl-CoA decarboxylase [Roseivivax lentus]SIS64367.1 malonyl-CoA decarboxylase [Roseivivax lentus]